MEADIERMVAARTFAVVGASTNPEKYGNKVFLSLRRHGKNVYAVNPNVSSAETLDGEPFYATVADLPERPEVVVAVVPPPVTEKIVDELAAAGINNLWMQPGAESERAVKKAREHGIATVYGGPCIMVLLRLASVN